jgi:uncharacterized membrane protein (UPF0136 family)
MNKLPSISNFPAWKQWLLFFILLMLMSWYYDFHKIMFLAPQSIHFWRQVDCLSFTLNYMMEDRGFFNPSVHYIGQADHGEMVTDFPIIFYLVGNIWKLTGQQEWIYRLLIFTLFTIGLSAVFLMLRHWYKSFFWASMVSLLLFTSPVIVYYSSNFVMNMPAFSFALLGISSFYWFVRTSQSKWLWISMLFYLIGGLLKVPALMSFVVVVFIFSTEFLGIIKYRDEKPIFSKGLADAIPMLIVVVSVFLWVRFINSYNQGNEGLFLVGLFPIWDLSWEQINKIVTEFTDYWYKQHFHQVLHAVTLLAYLWIMWNIRRLSNIVKAFVILLLIGVTGFILLWFQAMPNHDYYLTNSYMLYLVTWAVAIKLLLRHKPAIVASNITKIVFLIFFIINVVHARKEVNIRYWGWWNTSYFQVYQPMEGLKEKMREAGISRDDRVIVMGEGMPNASLYTIDSKGWTNFGGHMNNTDSTGISLAIESGAKYMVMVDTTWLSKDFVQPFTNDLLIDHGSVQVFRLTKNQ